MYSSFRNLCERWLRIPPDPEPPPGDESCARIFRAAPNFYRYLFIVWALKSLVAFFVLTWVAIAPVVLAFTLKRHGQKAAWFLLLIPFVVGTIIVLARIVALAIVRLDFEKRWYVVTDRSLRVREGVLSVREMTVTFANIQNLSISQGPIQRLLNIADLRVDTAGGGGGRNQGKHPGQNLHTAWFRGVNNAGEIRELIQERLRQFKDAGLGDREEKPAAVALRTPISPTVLDALRCLRDEARSLHLAVGENQPDSTPATPP